MESLLWEASSCSQQGLQEPAEGPCATKTWTLRTRGTENTPGFLKILEVFTNRKKKVRLEERQLLLSRTRVSFTGCSGLLCVCRAPLCVCSCQCLLFSQCINFPFVKYDFQIIKKRKKSYYCKIAKFPNSSCHTTMKSPKVSHMWATKPGFLIVIHMKSTSVCERVWVCACERAREREREKECVLAWCPPWV